MAGPTIHICLFWKVRGNNLLHCSIAMRTLALFGTLLLLGCQFILVHIHVASFCFTFHKFIGCPSFVTAITFPPSAYPAITTGAAVNHGMIGAVAFYVRADHQSHQISVSLKVLNIISGGSTPSIKAHIVLGI